MRIVSSYGGEGNRHKSKNPIIYYNTDFYFSIYTFVTFYLLKRLKLMKKEYRYRNIKDEFEKYNIHKLRSK